MTPEKTLWQQVLLQAVRDATQENPQGRDNIAAKRNADSWLRSGSELHVVCALAGMDGHFVREKYCSGQIDAVLLRRLEKTHRVAA